MNTIFLEINSARVQCSTMQGKRLNTDWSAMKKLWCIGDFTFEQLGEIFSIPATAIRKRASREKWKQLRQAASQRVTSGDGALTQHGEEIVDSAIRVGGKTTFRPRCAREAERLLSSLEESDVPDDLSGKEQFVDVLAKVERVGARSHGIDNDEGGNKFLVNLSVLAESPAVKAEA
jgi:hypothetical protein